MLVIWSERENLSKYLAIPILCMVALTMSWTYLMDSLSEAVSWLLYFLYVTFCAVFAVICHRLILTGTKPAGWIPEWSWRESKFLAWLLLLLCIVLAAIFLTVSILGIFFANIFFESLDKSPNLFMQMKALFQIPAFYVLARVCLVLPATAIDEKTSIKLALTQSRGNGWRLAVIVGALPFSTFFLVDLLYRDGATFFEKVILTFLEAAVSVIDVAALSIAYKEITKKNDS